ncbi:hypothetical protein PMPD1_1473 [Paramixta manurensis]|uniref:Homeobox protein YbgS n=2 Tax=Paramixta manurensis TaxID=2740817 RepID=A0A6M8U9S0_9GAMM|nr:hypothetical protein PMPD1_1473 [Erwiniaceae bacterium PD-1]
MNKFAIVFLATAMTLGSGAAMAANSNGNENSAADAGAKAPGAKENLPPNKVDNNKINTGDTNTANPGNGSMSADQIDKNSDCKDGKCPNVNEKVKTKQGGGSVDRQTDGTSQ